MAGLAVVNYSFARHALYLPQSRLVNYPATNTFYLQNTLLVATAILDPKCFRKLVLEEKL